MEANEKTLTLFTTRIRQLILQFKDMKKENADLYAMVDERDARISELEAKLAQAQNDYNSLKMARTRFRKEIISAHPADETLFLEMLDMKKRPLDNTNEE